MSKSKFTETFTTTKTTIKKVIDGYTIGFANVSIEPSGLTSISLVVGAKYHDKCASFFNKVDLQELINELQAVHDAMD